jgi:hypothetical protein
MRFLICLCLVCGSVTVANAQAITNHSDVASRDAELREHFGEQQFQSQGGFLLELGQKLPDLEWESHELIATVVESPAISTRWFNEQFDEVHVTAKSGRYYAYGEAPTPSGPPLRRAMTCCCVPRGVDLKTLAVKYPEQPVPESRQNEQRSRIDVIVDWWRRTEEGAVELAALLESDQNAESVRPGQLQMENATRHVS